VKEILKVHHYAPLKKNGLCSRENVEQSINKRKEILNILNGLPRKRSDVTNFEKIQTTKPVVNATMIKRKGILC
jgi:hypothetical protein